MTRTQSMHSQVKRLLKTAPFRSFSLNMENGDRIIIEHPENIAFDSVNDAFDEFHVVSQKLRYYGTFTAVTSIAEVDRGDLAA